MCTGVCSRQVALLCRRLIEYTFHGRAEDLGRPEAGAERNTLSRMDDARL